MPEDSLLTDHRRSGRIDLELPIEVGGTDSNGRGFLVQTHTQVLSLHGAKIVVSHGLVPEQILQVSCPSVGQDAEARVIGLFDRLKDSFAYGIEFLNPNLNFWKMTFPPVT